MSTPLYKSLKKNGTSFYAFPGASEDISAAYNNESYKMYFSKYVLLNFPKQNLDSGTNSNPITFDFENSFYKLNATGQQALTYQDQLIESLRNYVANHEEVLRDSKLNNTEYYYDTTAMETTTEKIFWKWCKKLNIIDYEVAVDGDQYFGNLVEFERNNVTDDAYFPELLWVERNVVDHRIIRFYETGITIPGYVNRLEVEFSANTNYKVGDKIVINNISDANSILLSPYGIVNGLQINVKIIIPADATHNQRAVLDTDSGLIYNGATLIESSCISKLVYHKLVQYIGEVNGVNNVQAQNRSYTEVYASIPDHTGSTPDILFRTMVDVNYKPGMYYPILPSQYQPEILGAELFNSPIVNTPQNYPGNYYGQFDTQYEYTYQTADGDTLRRSGDYYGVSGDINSPVINGSTLDGVTIDFNTAHYIKMNIYNRELTNFDQFNAMEVNNQPPQDFEFNSVLWYYTVEDANGNTKTNLYGISFLNNPDNNPVESEVGIRLPVYQKLAANDNQDGTSYQFSLNLNYNIINENPQDSYNPDAINSLFSFNIFNEAMRRLSSVNDSFTNIISEQTDLKVQLNNVKQLIYTQTDFSNMNTKIANLEQLLTLYQSNQLISSETIEVVSNVGADTIPTIFLNNTDTQYSTINKVNVTDLYAQSGSIPMNIAVPKNKNFLVKIVNNDETILSLPNNDKLTVYLSSDLYYKQSIDISIDATSYATQNKQLDFYVNYSNGITNQLPVLTKAIGSVDLPIYYNSYYQTPNSAKTWDRFDFDIDLNQDVVLNKTGLLTIGLTGAPANIIGNSIKKGDTLQLKDFILGTSSVIDFSGQYSINSINGASIDLDVTKNSVITSYSNANITSGVTVTLNNVLANKPYLSLNKGYNYRITRVDGGLTSSFADRYMIEKY